MDSSQSEYANIPDLSITISTNSPAPAVVIDKVSASEKRPVRAIALCKSFSHNNLHVFQSGQQKACSCQERDLKRQQEADMKPKNEKTFLHESKITWFCKKLKWPVRVATLAGLGVVIYMQMRLIDKAESIASSTAQLDQIGNQINANTAQIAGGVAVLDNILELLLNMTKKG
jgi:hypothetical protein